MAMDYVRRPVQVIECGKGSLGEITEFRNIVYQVSIRISPGKELIIIYKIIDNAILLILHDSYIILFSI